MTRKDAKIVFLPSGRRGNFPLGIPVLEAARSIGVDIDSVCGGRGLCGRCRVVCAVGDFSKHAICSRGEHLSPPGAVETRYGERRRPLAENHRLSCQALVTGDLVIDVPPESQLHRQVVRKQAEYRDITLNASVHLYYVEVEKADLREGGGDLQRVYDALQKEWKLSQLECEPAVLNQLQQALRSGDWRITVAVHGQSRIIAVWPGIMRHAFGLAVDIGSTTIAAHLYSLTTGECLATGGIMNPQIRFGEDLMSRVSYVLMHPDEAESLTRAVRDGVNQLISDVSREGGIDSSEILDITIAGNPIMHHLFLGISPVELGSAPFALATDGALDLAARDLDLDVNPGAAVYVLPCIAGHVGADAAAMILAEEPHLLEETSLVIDVGTNAEIVIGNRDRLLACSSPTGPAFEGAQISCGQRAAAGAIERVRIDPTTLEVRFRVIGSELWSDQTGFDDSVQAFGVTGICG
ncbi:MAG: ASKHA domain-containing protein, partial [Woeseiaceae bacterium]